MKSMTGFGFSEYRNENIHLSLNLKSYNNRFLDLYIYLPQFLAPLEPRVRDFLSQRTIRGRVELALKVNEFEEDIEVRLDKKAVQAYRGILEELAAEAGITDTVRLSHLLRIEGIIKLNKTKEIDKYWQLLEPLLVEAYNEFEETRNREGENTFKDIESNLSIIEDQRLFIEQAIPELEQFIKSELRSRFEELLGDAVDETRIYSEMAVMLMKSDVNEEIVRLASHLSNFRITTAKEGAVGKKLDFICQELNREINTIGSKSQLSAVNESVITVKDAIEKIREQLRNVE
ncbi:MAG: YicC family protein [Spirochaeta sp.]|nr:YicC family protein [Spirochaeta sp.]